MVFFTAIAGGRHLHVLGRTLMPLILPTGIFEHLPLLGILRTPSRAIVYTYFFLGLAVAWIVACIIRQSRLEAPVQGRLQWGQALIVGALSVGIVVDYLSINRESTPVICPPAYAVLANSDTSAGVLNLPMIYGGGNRFMMYQLCVDRPIVYASISRKINQTLSDRLDDLDASEKKAALKEAGVEHVVVHLALLDSVRSFDLAEYTRNYRLVFQDQTELVFEVD
jgi:hypothetical protein